MNGLMRIEIRYSDLRIPTAAVLAEVGMTAEQIEPVAVLERAKAELTEATEAVLAGRPRGSAWLAAQSADVADRLRGKPAQPARLRKVREGDDARWVEWSNANATVEVVEAGVKAGSLAPVRRAALAAAARRKTELEGEIVRVGSVGWERRESRSAAWGALEAIEPLLAEWQRASSVHKWGAGQQHFDPTTNLPGGSARVASRDTRRAGGIVWSLRHHVAGDWPDVLPGEIEVPREVAERYARVAA